MKNPILFIRARAKKLGIAHFKWWSAHEVRIHAALFGRFESIRAGQDPQPTDALIDSIWISDPRPAWASHYPRGGRYYDAFVQLVEAVDRRARTARGAEAA
jgi:hypothetical protein